jgi:hypothetical protein
VGSRDASPTRDPLATLGALVRGCWGWPTSPRWPSVSWPGAGSGPPVWRGWCWGSCSCMSVLRRQAQPAAGLARGHVRTRLDDAAARRISASHRSRCGQLVLSPGGNNTPAQSVHAPYNAGRVARSARAGDPRLLPLASGRRANQNDPSESTTGCQRKHRSSLAVAAMAPVRIVTAGPDEGVILTPAVPTRTTPPPAGCPLRSGRHPPTLVSDPVGPRGSCPGPPSPGLNTASVRHVPSPGDRHGFVPSPRTSLRSCPPFPRPRRICPMGDRASPRGKFGGGCEISGSRGA